MAACISTVQSSRLKTMVVPREHGAWGMLLIPMATGGVAALSSGVNGSALALFLCAAMSLFWLRTPVESWLGTSAIKAQNARERSYVLRVIAIFGLLAALSVAGLLINGRNNGLLAIGAISALALAVQAGVRRLGRKGRMPAQMIGAIALTSTAAGAYYVSTGRLDKTAIALWLANWLFACDQIHFVQLRIHASKAVTVSERLHQGIPFVAGQIGLISTIIVACRFHLLPAITALAFLPILFRGALWFVRERKPLDAHKLGFSELAQALVFGFLLCLTLLA